MNRILDNDIMGDEEFVERTLRPQYLKEYIGQDKVKNQLKIFIDSAKYSNSPSSIQSGRVPTIIPTTPG